MPPMVRPVPHLLYRRLVYATYSLQRVRASLELAAREMERRGQLGPAAVVRRVIERLAESIQEMEDTCGRLDSGA